MPAAITTQKGAGNSKTRFVSESPKSATGEVNAARAGNLEFVLLTDNDTNKEFTVVAADVREITAI